MWQWLVNTAATSAAGTLSSSSCLLGARLAAGTGPAVRCFLPTQVPIPRRPQRLQAAREKHSGQAGWGWVTDLLIRSTSILTPLSPSSALLPSSLFRAGSSSNGVMGGRKQVMVSARVRVTEQGNSLCIPFSFPSSSTKEWISPCRAPSPGSHLTSASPTPSFPLCRARGFSHIQTTRCLGFTGFSRHSHNPLASNQDLLHIQHLLLSPWEQKDQIPTTPCPAPLPLKDMEDPANCSCQANKVFCSEAGAPWSGRDAPRTWLTPCPGEVASGKSSLAGSDVTYNTQ